MTTALLVALSGGGGALARYGLSAAATGDGELWMILAINVLGSFLLGALMAAGPGSDQFRAAAGTGFLGGFTTYSTFSVQAMTELQNGRWGIAGVYVGGSVVLGLAAAFAGYALGRALR